MFVFVAESKETQQEHVSDALVMKVTDALVMKVADALVMKIPQKSRPLSARLGGRITQKKPVCDEIFDPCSCHGIGCEQGLLE